MKALFAAAITLALSSGAAFAESWYVVKGSTGSCVPFAPIYNGAPQEFAAMMRRQGHEVENKHAPTSSSAWYVIDNTNLVMVQGEEVCNLIAGIIASTETLPWVLRDAANEAMKDPQWQRALELARKKELSGQASKP
jgi:hypothetical protein